MSDKKEWVTIKIPETVRDGAKEDERTYGEIMEAGLGNTDSDSVEVISAREFREKHGLEGGSDSPVTLEATEYSKIADEVEERLIE